MRFMHKKNLAIIGVLVMVAIPIGIVYQRSVHHAQLGASGAKLRMHLETCIIYAGRNAGAFPTAEMWPTSLLESELLSEFVMESEYRDAPGETYVYVDGAVPNSKNHILVYENPLHWSEGVLTGFADMHVEMIDHETFEQMLAEQLQE